MKNKVGLVLFVAFGVIFFSSNAYAEEDSINEIRYYGSSSCAISDSTNRTVYIDKDLNEESPLAEWVSKNYAAVTSLSAEYGLPWEPIMAQGAIESNFGTSEEYEKHNIFFAGLSKEKSYPDIESSWRVIFEHWRLSDKKDLFSEEAIYDPSKYIDKIENYGYDSDYIDNLRNLTAEINAIIERSNIQKSGDIYNNTSAMKENIARNRGEGIDSFGNAVDYSSFECSCGGSSAASGLRWSGFWLSNNSLFGSQKAMVVGMSAEEKIKTKDYGLSLPESEKLQISFRIKKGSSGLANGDPYAAYPDGDYPHFLVDIKKKRLFQYFPINVDSAVKNNKNITIDIVGYTDNSSSSYYLWNDERVASTEWKYLAKLVQGIYEQSEKTEIEYSGDESDKIRSKISSSLNLTDYKPSLKCGTNNDLDVSYKDYEAKRFISYFEKTASIDEYALPNGSKNMPASFVAYFINRFTNLEEKNFDWGEPKDITKNLTTKYPSLTSGNDPAPYSIFSSTNGGVLCGRYDCGSTGVVLGVDNGLVLTIEQNYPQGKLEVKKRSLAELKNQNYDVSFVYLRPVINEGELKLGKQGQ